jgi:phage shock protein PspC (stress-responsive transcriptional regulator)
MTDAPHTSQHQPHASNGGAGHDGREQLERFFDWIRSSGVRRGDDRWLAGVCGAVAGRTGLDPLIVRGIAVVVAILGGPALFAYAIGWAFLPDSEGRIHAEQLVRGVFDPAMVAIITLFVFTFVPFTRGLWWEGAPLGWGMPGWLQTTLAVGWTIAVAIGAVWLVVFLLRRQSIQSGGGESGYRVGNAAAAPADPATPGAHNAPTLPYAAGVSATPTPTQPIVGAPGSAPQQPDRAWWDHDRAWRDQQREWHQAQERYRRRHPGAGYTAIVLGIGLAAGAVTAAVYSGGAWSPATLLVGLAVTLGVLALGIIVSGIRGRDSGTMGGFAFLAAVGLLVLGVFPAGTQFVPFGAPNWTVVTRAADHVPGYAVIAGNPTVDLSELDTAGGQSRTIDVWLGFGQTELILPADRPVRIETNTIIGGVDYGSTSAADHGGVFFHDSHTVNGAGKYPAVQIRIWSLVGQLEIVTGNR